MVCAGVVVWWWWGGLQKISVLPHVVICKTTDLKSGKPNQSPPQTDHLSGRESENLTDSREVIRALLDKMSWTLLKTSKDI